MTSHSYKVSVSWNVLFWWICTRSNKKNNEPVLLLPFSEFDSEVSWRISPTHISSIYGWVKSTKVCCSALPQGSSPPFRLYILCCLSPVPRRALSFLTLFGPGAVRGWFILYRLVTVHYNRVLPPWDCWTAPTDHCSGWHHYYSLVSRLYSPGPSGLPRCHCLYNIYKVPVLNLCSM